MKTLTKRELAKQLQTVFPFMSQKLAVDVIEQLADLIVCHFQEDGKLFVVRSFGALKLVKRKAFTGTNPQTGAPLPMRARRTLAFKPSAEVVRRINQL